VLVEAVGSERECVARAAEETLLDECERWRLLDHAATSRRLAVLAKALSENVEYFGPTAQATARSLAQRILFWPLDTEAVSPDEVLLSCEEVLRVTTVRGSVSSRPPQVVDPLPGTMTNEPLIREPAIAADEPRRESENRSVEETVFNELAQIPGGHLQLPLESVSEHEQPPMVSSLASNTSMGEKVQKPRELSPGSLAWPSNPLRVPDRLSAPPEGLRAFRPSQTMPYRSARQPSIGTPHYSPLSLEQPHPASLPSTGPVATFGDGPETRNTRISPGRDSDGARAIANGTTDNASTEAIMRQLHSPRASVVAQARDELRARGFSPTHLRLAESLFHWDVAVRRQVVDALPTISGINPVPWLLALARDSHADVRLAALSVLATTGNELVLAEVRRLATPDTDARIQRLAERLAGDTNQQPSTVRQY